MADRRLSPDEAALWARVMATVTPIAPHAVARDVTPQSAPASAMPIRRATQPPLLKPLPKHAPPSGPGVTLDAGWDRRLSRGTVEPDATIDLHGHTLASAHALLDRTLDQARARGDRVILLVTGKPPRPDSARPHARGAIRSAVGDWLAASRHAAQIAAVRGAAPRHGGTGALYIILRRPRSTAKS